VALVIQRIWSELGFRLNKFVAWFITFNFINIAWVFFRAKEWDDALKVLKGMLGLGGGLTLNSRLEKKLGFLSEYGIKFDIWNPNMHVANAGTMLGYMTISFLLVLVCKNSIEKLLILQTNKKNLIFTAVCFVLGVLNMNKISQFLYFNF